MTETLSQIPASEQEVIDKLGELNPALHLFRVDSNINVDEKLKTSYSYHQVDPRMERNSYPQCYFVVNGHIIVLKILEKNTQKILPKCIGNLTELRILIVDHCEDMKYLLKSIEKFKNLAVLSLSHCNLTSLPENIGNLTNLREIELVDNNLSSLPESIGNLTNLKNLRLIKINLTSLPESIGNLKNLADLNISRGKLTTLPESIGNLTNLESIQLSNNNLSSLPESIGNLTNLKNLRLIKINLTSLPESIGNLTNLESIQLSDNNLSSLPESIGNLMNLKYLCINGNFKHLSLPESIGNVKNLAVLDISRCKLTTLPESIGNLTNLRKIELIDTDLNSLPESIGNLTNLESINLMYNNLTRLPESFVNLKKYSLLKLYKNPLRSLSNIHFENLYFNFDTLENPLITLPFKEYLQSIWVDPYLTLPNKPFRNNNIFGYSFSVENLTTKGKNLLRPFDDDEEFKFEEAVFFERDLYDDFEETDKNIDRDLKPLATYYEHSPLVLANKYCKEPKSLSTDELERLIWEAGPIERDLLESRFPPENDIVRKINDRMKIELKNGYSILI